MHAAKRLFEDCPACENRGLICVGEDDQDFPCPYCNCWCSLCLSSPTLSNVRDQEDCWPPCGTPAPD